MGNTDDEPVTENEWDRRRKAPAHFWAKAHNARYSARVLQSLDEHVAVELAAQSAYRGTRSQALWEAFIREASIALELILKALICAQCGKPPRTTHDVYALWSEARLPSLKNDDWQRLAEMTEVLNWAGRYAAPTGDKKMDEARVRYTKHEHRIPLGATYIIEPAPLKWSDFDALYQIVLEQFLQPPAYPRSRAVRNAESRSATAPGQRSSQVRTTSPRCISRMRPRRSAHGAVRPPTRHVLPVFPR